MTGFIKNIRICTTMLVLLFSGLTFAADRFDKISSKIADKFSVSQIDAKTVLKKMSASNLVLLDAREKGEYKLSHLPGAKFIGFKKFDLDKTLKSLNKSNEVVVYCSVGYRSGKIAEKLKRKGFKVYNLKGGIFNWSNKGYSLVNDQNKPTTDVHGYNRSWSKWITKGNVRY